MLAVPLGARDRQVDLPEFAVGGPSYEASLKDQDTPLNRLDQSEVIREIEAECGLEDSCLVAPLGLAGSSTIPSQLLRPDYRGVFLRNATAVSQRPARPYGRPGRTARTRASSASTAS